MDQKDSSYHISILTGIVSTSGNFDELKKGIEAYILRLSQNKINVMQSTRYSLNVRDLLKGLILAVGTPAAVIIQQSIAAGNLVFDWKIIGMAAAGGFMTYIIKNYLTDDVKTAQNIIVEAKQKEIDKQNQPK